MKRLIAFVFVGIMASVVFPLEAKIAELEARLEQQEKRAEKHAGKLQLHGGMDLRLVKVQGAKMLLFMHEVEMGLGAQLSDNISTLVELAQHYGESVELHQGYLTYNFGKAALRSGKYRVKFGLENQTCFFGRRTIAPSAMREVIFGSHGWSDVGVELAAKGLADSTITATVLNGNNAASFGTGTLEVSNDSLPIALNISKNIGPVSLGGSYAFGKWDASDAYNASLIGFDAIFTNGPLQIVAEYISRNKQQATGDVNANGYYVLGVYTLPVASVNLNNIELLVGYGSGDDGAGSKETRLTLQPTLNILESVKLRFSYENRIEEPVDAANNRAIVQLACEF